jgi:hypothetical protein
VALIQSAAFGGAIVGGLAQIGAQWRPYGSGWDYTVRGSSMPMDPKFLGGGHCVMDPTNTFNPYQCSYKATSLLDLAPGALIGLNVGLVAGLLGAYLPDQSDYGPSWKRVLLIDLAAAAGTVAGGVGGCVANVSGCLNGVPDDHARAIAAVSAIGGMVVGLVGGVLLTRHVDDDPNAQSAAADKPKATITTSMFPLRAPDGSYSPGIGAFGTF